MLGHENTGCSYISVAIATLALSFQTLIWRPWKDDALRDDDPSHLDWCPVPSGLLGNDRDFVLGDEWDKDSRSFP